MLPSGGIPTTGVGMKDEDGPDEEGAAGSGEAHLSVVPKPAPQNQDAVTISEPDLLVNATPSAAVPETSEEIGLASVTRLPVVSPPRDRMGSWLQRLEGLERDLAEVSARLDLALSPGAKKEDVVLKLQRLVLDRLRQAGESDGGNRDQW